MCDQQQEEAKKATLGQVRNSGVEFKQEDPWQHRSSGMRCKTCMWFCPKKSDPESTMVGGPIFTPQVYHVGRCRRHAPTMNGYPVVFVNDWCGDHKLNENKI